MLYRTHDVRKTSGPETSDCIFYEQGRYPRFVRQAMWACRIPFTPIFPRMILLVRDYHANAVRSEWNPSRYAVNVRAYDAFEGEKMILYYEDMKDDFAEVERLLDFLGIAHDDPFEHFVVPLLLDTRAWRPEHSNQLFAFLHRYNHRLKPVQKAEQQNVHRE